MQNLKLALSTATWADRFLSFSLLQYSVPPYSAIAIQYALNMRMSALVPAVPSVGSRSFGVWRYDVFLSFRGETRLNFTDHLYAALLQRGITTFRDDEELERGELIAPMLFKAIEESRFCIVVFSPNYASSSWCLSELEKIHECSTMSRGLQTVLPVFFNVDPTHVRKQTGCFEKAFAYHEEAYGKDSAMVLKWRKALKEIGNLSGWHLDNKPQSVAIEEIVRKVFTKVNFELPREYPSLVGMGPRAGKLQAKLSGSSDDVLILGIPEMGGIGKTTIARVVYDRIRLEFDGCSFLANVSEISKKRGIVFLQEQLLRDILKDKKIRVTDVYHGVSMIKKSLNSRKVLIVLDDVAERVQLAVLAGNSHWFGPGSRVIITTRDQHLLVQHGVDELFYPEKLVGDEALHLFSLRAFKRDRPPEPYLQLSNKVVMYTSGLPLALTVLGSFLFGRSMDEWRSTLNRLKTTPMEEITDTLKISFDGLHEKEKKIFLDIACFFKGENTGRVMKIWDGCGFDPDIGIRVLVDKFLISIGDKQELWMHDLLQHMGWEIVRQESPVKLGRRSRLWRPEDVRYVLENDKGSELVEGVLLLDTDEISSMKIESLCVDSKTFRKMNRLRLLKLENVELSGDLGYLSGELRFLDWDCYQKQSLPAGFQTDKLVDLGLRHSLIVKLSSVEKPMKNLKYLDLSHSTYLIVSPDFSLLPSLEELLLVGCVGLSRLHPSIGLLKKLIMLNLSGCMNLLELPSSISGLRSLKYLDLFACSKLIELPEAVGHLLCLEELDIGHTMIQPSNFLTWPKSLKGLSFSGCKGQLFQTWRSFISSFFWKMDHLKPTGIPLTSLSNFCNLQSLDLSDCNVSDHAVPIDLSSLSSLEHLDLTGNNFARVPFDVSLLKKLESLGLESCERLEALPSLPPGIRLVIANHCPSLETLPDDIGIALSQKCDFSFVNCQKLANCASNGVANRLLKSLLQNQLQTGFKESPLERTSNFYIPGCEVPRWFICQTTGAIAKLQMGSDWFNDSFQGFVICAVFEDIKLRNNLSQYYQVSYSIGVDGQEQSPSTSFLMSKSYGVIHSKHIWVSFLSRETWMEYYGYQHGARNQVQLRFYSHVPDIKVTRSGIHPVYTGDQEGREGITVIQGSSTTNFRLDILPSSFELPGVDDGCRTKRDRDFYRIGDGPKLIVNGSFDDKAHPKRFKEL